MLCLCVADVRRGLTVAPNFLPSPLHQPNNVEVLPGGLAGIPAGLKRLEKGVSAVKLISRPYETA